MKRWPMMMAAIASLPALAGPPYITDDPEPTDHGHYETYFFAEGASASGGRDGSAGMDFNYGAGDDLQLTAVLPLAWGAPASGSAAAGLGNIELAAKYRFLRQDDAGFDAAFFPRVFLPAGNAKVGERHASLLLPVWIGRSWGKWSGFGGGGCTIDRGSDSRDFCELGAVVTLQASERLQIGTELYHQTPDSAGARVSTDLGFGAVYDLDPHLHLMASVQSGLQNRAEADRTSWYAALLWTAP